MFIRRTLLLFTAALHLNAQCATQEVFAKVDTLLHNRKYEEAAKVLSTLSPCNLSALERFQVGWLYGRTRNFTAALEAFKAVPPDVPDLVTHTYAVALSQFELADYRAASDVLKSIRSQPGFDPKCANLLAVSYSKLGLFQDASSVLAQEIHANPNDLTAYLNMVTVLTEGGDLPKAAGIAAEASRLFPQSQEALTVHGAANILLGHLDEAQKAFQAAIEIAPDNAEPHFFLALTEYKLGNYAAAVHVLNKAIDAHIADSDLHYLMAESLLRISPVDRGKVMAELNRAVTLNGKSASARTLRGRVLIEAGEAKQAVSDLQLAAQLDPTSRSAVYNLARAYRAEGNAAAAKPLFEQLRSEKGDTLTELGDQRLKQALRQDAGEKAP